MKIHTQIGVQFQLKAGPPGSPIQPVMTQRIYDAADADQFQAAGITGTPTDAEVSLLYNAKLTTLIGVLNLRTFMEQSGLFDSVLPFWRQVTVS